MYNAELFDFGNQLTHDLAARLHKPDGPPIVISQRNVSGVTRAVIPIMYNRSVRAFSIGPNPAAQPPKVSSAFLWKFDENVSSPSIIVLYHKGNYGGLDRSDAVLIDGFEHVALFDWYVDNAGPYTAQQVVECIADSECDSSSYSFYSFSRLLLKAGEHTFGADVSELLKAPTHSMPTAPTISGPTMG